MQSTAWIATWLRWVQSAALRRRGRRWKIEIQAVCTLLYVASLLTSDFCCSQLSWRTGRTNPQTSAPARSGPAQNKSIRRSDFSVGIVNLVNATAWYFCNVSRMRLPRHSSWTGNGQVIVERRTCTLRLQGSPEKSVPRRIDQQPLHPESNWLEVLLLTADHRHRRLCGSNQIFINLHNPSMTFQQCDRQTWSAISQNWARSLLILLSFCSYLQGKELRGAK